MLFRSHSGWAKLDKGHGPKRSEETGRAYSGILDIKSRIVYRALVTSLTIVLFLAVIILAGESEGATITVDDDEGGGDYQTIQAAIDNATEGDTVRVFEGLYNEDVKIKKSVNLLGNISNRPIIVSTGSLDVISLLGDHTTIDGFEIVGGVKGQRGTKYGISFLSMFTRISNNTIRNCTYGIFYQFTNYNVIENNTIFNNSGTGIVINAISKFNVIQNNSLHTNENGITIGGAEFTEIVANICVNNSRTGIDCAGISNVVMANNCSKNAEGIVIAGTYTAQDNECGGNKWTGMVVHDPQENQVLGNSLSSNGVGIRYSARENNSYASLRENNSFSENVNDDIRFFKSHDDTFELIDGELCLTYLALIFGVVIILLWLWMRFG